MYNNILVHVHKHITVIIHNVCTDTHNIHKHVCIYENTCCLRVLNELVLIIYFEF